ncbi:hypothetical protein BU24DRAFT_496198 [Aaosphaeria arxii CBS 175.79]|uniref:RING-type domain-containing protein n=1 Tax=Aaosphaeria arxii CBS 175.79 TaxID=1450172 RepID=A0A6A5XE47_9PLEO|nr:uncharacterized protein BU24DRAFT_496198 [Aaosphaeria arxii CBS 175.79]KAF2011067.1 hypothetical protein BU24DRAFT_496198 [Aaosphaeria arxii CBS 175.79]
MESSFTITAPAISIASSIYSCESLPSLINTSSSPASEVPTASATSSVSDFELRPNLLKMNSSSRAASPPSSLNNYRSPPSSINLSTSSTAVSPTESMEANLNSYKSPPSLSSILPHPIKLPISRPTIPEENFLKGSFQDKCSFPIETNGAIRCKSCGEMPRVIFRIRQAFGCGHTLCSGCINRAVLSNPGKSKSCPCCGATWIKNVELQQSSSTAPPFQPAVVGKDTFWTRVFGSFMSRQRQ